MAARWNMAAAMTHCCWLLQDMGFFDQEANIRALQATGGNVNAAVDRLLQGFP